MYTKANWSTLATQTQPIGLSVRCLRSKELSWKTAVDNFPLVIEPSSGQEFSSVAEIFSLNRTWILQQLFQYGALLFRGFYLDSTNQFEDALSSLELNPSPVYPFGISPRSKISGNIFNSTYHPSPLILPPHTEMAYLHTRPSWIAFYCDLPPQKYGETPCFDMHKIYQMLSDNMRHRFTKSCMKYVRCIPFKKQLFSVARTIEETFGSGEIKEIENNFPELEIKFKVLDKHFIQAETETPIVVVHPITGKPCLNAQFNHPAAYLYTLELFGDRYSFLLRRLLKFLICNSKSRHGINHQRTYLAESPALTDEEIRKIQEVFYKNSTIFSWQQGDILLLDNIRSGHSRLNFSGKRKIVTCFGDLYDLRESN